MHLLQNLRKAAIATGMAGSIALGATAMDINAVAAAASPAQHSETAQHSESAQHSGTPQNPRPTNVPGPAHQPDPAILKRPEDEV